jgi:hypothetical protein
MPSVEHSESGKTKLVFVSPVVSWRGFFLRCLQTTLTIDTVDSSELAHERLLRGIDRIASRIATNASAMGNRERGNRC